MWHIFSSCSVVAFEQRKFEQAWSKTLGLHPFQRGAGGQESVTSAADLLTVVAAYAGREALENEQKAAAETFKMMQADAEGGQTIATFAGLKYAASATFLACRNNAPTA